MSKHRRAALSGCCVEGGRLVVEAAVTQAALAARPGLSEEAPLLALVLHHIADPLSALKEAARILKPGGTLLVVDMLPHDRETYRQQMGHVWLGTWGTREILIHAATAKRL